MFAALFPPSHLAEFDLLQSLDRFRPAAETLIAPAMKMRNVFIALLTTLALGACSTDAVGPVKVPLHPSLAVTTGSTGTGDYIVLLKGNAKDFQTTVTNLGGRVTFYHQPTGFVTVSGLTTDAAAQLRGVSGVSEVDADFAVGLSQPGATVTTDGYTLAPDALAADAAPPPPPPGTGHPEVALLGSWQWDMHSIRADTVWARGKLGSPNVTVAIIDTGLDYDNRDLRTLVDLSRSASFADAWVGDTTTTNNPNPDTLTISDAQISSTLFPTRNAIQDFNGHGTNVGATVSSRAFAFAGVTAQTTLIGVKVLGRNGKGNFGQILSGVLFAADQGADVANMSLGGDFPRSGNGNLVSLINRVFNYAKQQGMLIVTSAGNEGEDLQHNGNLFSSFCDAPHVVCVTADGPPTWLDFDAPGFFSNALTPAFYTNFGRSVASVAAPGGNGVLAADGIHLVPSDGWPWGAGPHKTSVGSPVWSFCSRTKLNIVGKTGAFGNLVRDLPCATGGQLLGLIGTSQAAPHVSGLAALLVADGIRKQPQRVKQLIEQSADATNPLFGRGHINVQSALGL